MSLEECLMVLSKFDPEGDDPEIDWAVLNSAWADVAKISEAIVSSIAADAWCTAQEWDRRIDCCIKLADGRVIAEMVNLTNLTRDRLEATAERLRRRAAGEHVMLIDELPAPTVIRKI